MRCTPTIHELIVLTLPPRHRCPLTWLPASRLLLAAQAHVEVRAEPVALFQRNSSTFIPRAADTGGARSPWPPVESYTENPACWPSRFPSCFSPKIFGLEVYLKQLILMPMRPAKTSYAAALKRSKRKASRSRSGRSLVRFGKCMVPPLSCFKASSIGPSFCPSSRSDTCSR